MQLFDSEAIVVNTAPIGDADLLVTLFTRDRGKIKAVARGGRVLKSRFSGFFQPLSILRVIYLGHEKQELYRINSCDSVKICDISTELRQLVSRCCMAEMLELCCGPHEPSLPIYRLAGEGIELLSKCNGASNLVLGFAVKAFALCGYAPRLVSCAVCDGNLEGGGLRFSPAEGGAVCARCSARAGTHYPMSLGCLKFLRAAMGLDLSKSSRIKLGARLQKEARDIVFNHVSYHLGREMRSWRFLEL